MRGAVCVALDPHAPASCHLLADGVPEALRRLLCHPLHLACGLRHDMQRTRHEVMLPMQDSRWLTSPGKECAQGHCMRPSAQRAAAVRIPCSAWQGPALRCGRCCCPAALTCRLDAHIRGRVHDRHRCRPRSAPALSARHAPQDQVLRAPLSTPSSPLQRAAWDRTSSPAARLSAASWRS